MCSFSIVKEYLLGYYYSLLKTQMSDLLFYIDRNKCWFNCNVFLFFIAVYIICHNSKIIIWLLVVFVF